MYRVLSVFGIVYVSIITIHDVYVYRVPNSIYNQESQRNTSAVTMISYVTMTVGKSRLIKHLGVPISKVKILQWFQKTGSMRLPWQADTITSRPCLPHTLWCRSFVVTKKPHCSAILYMWCVMHLWSCAQKVFELWIQGEGTWK